MKELTFALLWMACAWAATMSLRWHELGLMGLIALLLVLWTIAVKERVL